MKTVLILVLSSCLGLAQLGYADDAEDQAKIGAWVRQLGSADYQTRQVAWKKLVEAGASAEAELRKGLRSRDPEVRRTSRQLIKRLLCHEVLRWHGEPPGGDTFMENVWLVRSRVQYRALLKAAAVTKAPQVDFRRHQLILLSAGFSHTAGALELRSVQVSDYTVTVSVRVVDHGGGGWMISNVSLAIAVPLRRRVVLRVSGKPHAEARQFAARIRRRLIVDVRRPRELKRGARVELPELLERIRSLDWKPGYLIEKRLASTVAALAAKGADALPALRKMLEDKRYMGLVCQRVLLVLEQMGEVARPLLPLVLAKLQSSEDGVAIMASRVLARIGTHDQQLKAIKELRSRTEKRCGWEDDAIEALGRFGPKARRAIPVILDRLQDGDRHAPLALARIAGKQSVIRLVRSLRDDRFTSWHRAEILWALAASGMSTGDLLPHVTRVIEQDKELHEDLSRCLVKLGSVSRIFMPELLRRLKTKKDLVVARTIRAVASPRQRAECVSVLLKQLHQQLPETEDYFSGGYVGSIAQCLVVFADVDARVIKALIRAYAQARSSRPVLAQAILPLATPAQAKLLLTRALHSELDPKAWQDPRVSSIRALAAFDLPALERSAPALLKLFKSRQKSVRRAAEQVLLRIYRETKQRPLRKKILEAFLGAPHNW